MDIHSRMGPAGPDCETVQAIVCLCPPSIDNRKIEAAVQNNLLTTGAGRFEGTPRVVQPHINAPDHVTAHIEVIVLNEHEFIGKSAVASQFGDLLEHSLPGVIARVRLSGTEQRHW